MCDFFPGKVFPLKDESELIKFTNFISTSLEQDTAIRSGEIIGWRVKRSSLITYPQFSVDDAMKSVTVSVVKDQLHMFGSVSLIGPGNVKVNPQTFTSSSMIFEIPNPKAGHY